MSAEIDDLSPEEYFNLGKNQSIERRFPDVSDNQINIRLIEPFFKSSQIIEKEKEIAVLRQTDFAEPFTPDITTTNLSINEKAAAEGRMNICNLLQTISMLEIADLKLAQRYFVFLNTANMDLNKSLDGFNAQLVKSSFAFTQGRQEIFKGLPEPQKQKKFGLFGGTKK